MVAFPRQCQWLLLALLFSLASLSVLLTPRFRPPLPSLSRQSSSTWLIATMSAAYSLQRRSIIRATWQTLYASPNITTRFFIANPGELWMPLIKAENETYGDLIMLPKLKESSEVANHYKAYEFYAYLVKHYPGWRYTFISKIDDDSFLDIPTFRRDFLAPLIAQSPPAERTLIARQLSSHDDAYTYPGGQFYTATWDLMLLVEELYSSNPIYDEDEDLLFGRLLYEHGENIDFVTLDNPIAFDYDAKNEDPWAWSHKILPGAINPHKMKEDEDYLRVASHYDKTGLKAIL